MLRVSKEDFRKTHNALQAYSERTKNPTVLTLAAKRLFDELYTSAEERNAVLRAVAELAAQFRYPGPLGQIAAFELICWTQTLELRQNGRGKP